MSRRDTSGRGIKLEPHPHELESSIASGHVVVFGYPEDDVQFEVSGDTDADDLSIDWTTISIDGDEVVHMLEDDHVYRERCEDLTDTPYELHVRAGERHPKGKPIHTERGDQE